MSVVQEDTPNTYRLRDTVPLHLGAHTLAIDQVTHRVYVAYASLFCNTVSDFYRQTES
jgi:hypothetical protein